MIFSGLFSAGENTPAATVDGSIPRQSTDGGPLVDGDAAGGVEGGAERGEGAGVDGGTDVSQQLLVVMEIVDRREHRTEDLVATVEMAQVRARVTAGAGVAG